MTTAVTQAASQQTIANAGTEQADPKVSAKPTLNERIAARRAQAESQRMEVLRGGKATDTPNAKPSTPQRGPDGKFAGQAPQTDGVEKPEVEAKKPSTAEEQAKAAAEQARKQVEAAQQAFTKLQVEAEETAELALARITSLEAQNKRLRGMLAQAKVRFDPRDDEIMRYRERDYATSLGAQRQQAMAQEQARAQQAAQEQQAQAQLENACRSVLTAHPELNPRNGQEQVEFWKAVYNGADPVALAAIVVPALKARAAAPAPPRALPRSGATGDKVSYDPRDVADKWKARQRAV